MEHLYNGRVDPIVSYRAQYVSSSSLTAVLVLMQTSSFVGQAEIATSTEVKEEEMLHPLARLSVSETSYADPQFESKVSQH